MRLPDEMQEAALLAPDTHFPLLTARCPILAVTAHSNRPNGIEGFGKHRVMQSRSSQGAILHLDALQIRVSNEELRQIELPQVPTQFSQQGDQVRWSITLRGWTCSTFRLFSQLL